MARDVGAGGKGLVAAGDDDAADAVVGVEGQQRLRPAPSISASFSAFSCLGRFSVIRRGGARPSPRVSTRMCSGVMRDAAATGSRRWRAARLARHRVMGSL
jgi:hypothetical protein